MRLRERSIWYEKIILGSKYRNFGIRYRHFSLKFGITLCPRHNAWRRRFCFSAFWHKKFKREKKAKKKINEKLTGKTPKPYLLPFCSFTCFLLSDLHWNWIKLNLILKARDSRLLRTEISFRAAGRRIRPFIETAHLIVLSHYDVPSKQIYCLSAKNHSRQRGYSKFKLIKK